MQLTRRHVALSGTLLFTAFCCTLSAQTNTASIRGTASDPTGAVVPAAQVVLINTGTGVQSSVKTNESGEYLFEFLTAGSYKIEAQVSGFKKFVRENITLDLGRQLRIDVGLEPGQVTETVNVAAQAPLLDTEN